MTLWHKLSVGLALSAIFLVSSCGSQEVTANNDPARLAEIARNYAEGGHLGGTPSATPAPNQQTPAAGEEYDYESQMMMYLVRKDYDHLDQAERDARFSKASGISVFTPGAQDMQTRSRTTERNSTTSGLHWRHPS
jgi:hypothetical protein